MSNTSSSKAKAQHFVAKDLRSAFNKVRESLGADALILEQKVSSKKAEVWASSESEADLHPAPNVRSEKRAAVRDDKVILSNRYNNETPGLEHLNYKYLNRLQRMGFDTRFIEKIDCENASNWSEVKAALINTLPLNAMPLVLTSGIYCMIGRTGVGKTSTIIKLAANHVIQHGPDSVAILTLDSHRLAGSEQLLMAGDLLNIHVEELISKAALAPALERLAHKKLIFIDTPGGAEHNNIQVPFPLKMLLVIPATHHKNVIKSQVEKMVQPQVVLTHLDEPECLGECISQIHDAGGKICYAGTGANIPDDLESASAELLLSIIESQLLRTSDAQSEVEK
ncbi:MAG: hypothetical protein KUG75_12205 [Pseudomonadales bacterium]|nr:hypothetical protein [Pseudomonadales bacterium]